MVKKANFGKIKIQGEWRKPEKVPWNMKHIFNSLGSNYTNEFVWMAHWSRFLGKEKKRQSFVELKNKLGEKFNGQAFLFYKGRDAIEFALRAHKITSQDQIVLTQAFTCYAIEEAILRAGAEPVYVDIEKNSTNLSLQTLKVAYQKNPQTKTLIVQHSLGHPAEIEKIAKFCQENKILLIEDLAQSFGAKNNEGKLLGTHADAIVSSFGRDKIIDSVTGGLAILKNEKAQGDGQKIYQTLKTGPKLAKETLYPLATWKIRKTYGWGIGNFTLGKVFHKILNLSGFFTNPITAVTNRMTILPPIYAHWALWQLNDLDAQLAHRQKIANVYFENLKNTLTTKKDLQTGTIQRFALKEKNPEKILSKLSKQKFHLSDRWYREAVDCGKTGCSTLYKKGSCPNAEQLSEKIINLPTHKNIKKVTAKKLATKIESIRQK